MVTLITGSSGTLGTELKKKFSECLSTTRDELDIVKKQDVLNFFQGKDIDLIFHTAALTSIRFCEKEKAQAMKVNVEGTKNLVEATLQTNPNAKFVYISTACVFDGHTGMYTESSIPYPENFYALTKLLGEYEITKLKNFLIIRTNFVAKKTWPYPKAFTDRFGTYLFADAVAEGIRDVQKENFCGIVHIVGDKKISMFDIAKIITPEIKPMTINDYQGPRLTIDMSLDTERWKKYTLK